MVNWWNNKRKSKFEFHMKGISLRHFICLPSTRNHFPGGVGAIGNRRCLFRCVHGMSVTQPQINGRTQKRQLALDCRWPDIDGDGAVVGVGDSDPPDCKCLSKTHSYLILSQSTDVCWLAKSKIDSERTEFQDMGFSLKYKNSPTIEYLSCSVSKVKD